MDSQSYAGCRRTPAVHPAAQQFCRSRRSSARRGTQPWVPFLLYGPHALNDRGRSDVPDDCDLPSTLRRRHRLRAGPGRGSAPGPTGRHHSRPGAGPRLAPRRQRARDRHVPHGAGQPHAAHRPQRTLHHRLPRGGGRLLGVVQRDRLRAAPFSGDADGRPGSADRERAPQRRQRDAGRPQCDGAGGRGAGGHRERRGGHGTQRDRVHFGLPERRPDGRSRGDGRGDPRRAVHSRGGWRDGRVLHPRARGRPEQHPAQRAQLRRRQRPARRGRRDLARQLAVRRGARRILRRAVAAPDQLGQQFPLALAEHAAAGPAAAVGEPSGLRGGQ